MGAEFGRRGQSRISQWLRGRRPKETGPDPAEQRESLLLASAAAGFPLVPAAHPIGYRCSCERIGCPTPGQHSVSQAWQTQASTEPERIRRWMHSDPESNFITATGMIHDVLDVPQEAGREALETLLSRGIDVGPVAESGTDRMLFFTATRGTPEDEDEWWPCALDCQPETMDEHPGLRWHCRGSFVLVPPSRLPGDLEVVWVRGPEHPLPDPLTLLEALGDSCGRYAGAARAKESAEYDDVRPSRR